jgi:histidine ammonia-lyase
MPAEILLDGRSLDPQRLVAIAHGASARFSEASLAAMDRSSEVYARIGPPGLLTRKATWLSGAVVAGEGSDAIASFVLGHCAGVGEPLEAPFVRALIAARAQVFATGATGVRRSAAESWLRWLGAPTPVVPSRGALGAAGSATLAHLAAVVCGFGGEIRGEAGVESVTAVDRRTRVPAFVVPNEKEALAFINGDTLSVVLAAFACVRARRLLESAEAACALSFEVVRADRRCLDARAMEARHHPGPIGVAARLREQLGGSSFCVDGGGPDPFSVRCAPAVLGAAWEALDSAEAVVTRELNAAADNPLIFDEDLVEAGNFHGAPVALAMDHLKIALVQVASIAERRVFRMTYGQLSGLPSFLVPGTGLNSGLMLAQYTAASLVSEGKGLAHPASVDAIPTVQHREDHVPMSPIAARGALSIAEILADVVAIELLCAAQGLDCRWQGEQAGFPAGRGTAISHAAVRSEVPRWDDDRALHPDLHRLGVAVRAGRFAGSAHGW